MKLIFTIDYRTQWGESLCLCGNIPALGNGNAASAPAMQLHGDSSWRLTIDIPDDTPDFTYQYMVRREKAEWRHEWGHGHTFRRGSHADVYRIFDHWNDIPADKPFYASAFTHCINRRQHPDRPQALRAGMLSIRVMAPTIRPDEMLAITGEPEALGNWDPQRAITLNDSGFPEWETSIYYDELNFPFQYKFLILKKDTHEVVAWEARNNRVFTHLPIAPGEIIIESGLRFVNPLGHWKGAGTAIPVFSIRTEQDYGVGDFYDLMTMIDWTASTGQTFLQILPINDTTMTYTWMDSYPYNANSTFALHPMYLRLSELGTLDDPERQAYYDKLGHELNALPQIDYERVNRAKTEFTKAIFAQNGADVLTTDEYQQFEKRNAYWLTPYAAFCVLRDRFGTPDFEQWGEYSRYEPERVARMCEENRYDINYVKYIQFNLDKQMRHVSDYARTHGVALKGDIPIGISRNSVDAWVNPRLFNLDCQAGAPPDDFSVLGQNWGFPTYNWEEMSRDGFKWWKDRMQKMAEYFDAFRIDHVLGFFRIWQIPMDAIHGLLGVFNPALPFTPDELRSNYDFWLDVNLHTTPYIMDYFLGDFFGEYTDEARSRFLDSLGYGRYCLKSEFNTQRKVARYFSEQPKEEKNERMCNALLGLIDNVLFIEDPYEKGKYHPRISAQYTYIYRSLSDYERWCFDRLYNDFYYHRHNDFWYGKAMWKLPPLLNATDMLVCAEDLGMIPACVPAVMDKLQILSLEIQRMPKNPATPFGETWNYPYYSVCTTSTHDMGGIRQWWEENPEATQRFYNNILHEHGNAPAFAEPWVCDKIISLHLESPSMLAILPLQDWLSMDARLRRKDPREEQINVPANSRHYWRYRMHLTVEEMMSDTPFNTLIHDKILRTLR